MSRYKLTLDAQQDLVEIRDQYEREAGLRGSRRLTSELVNAFRMLARTPGAGHTRVDFVGTRPVFVLAREGVFDFVSPSGKRG